MSLDMEWKIPNWPIVTVKDLNDEDATAFSRRKRAAEKIKVDEKRLKTVAKRMGMRADRLEEMMRRAETLHPDGLCWGYRALLPNTKLDYQRKAEEGKGKAGLFNASFVKYPDLRDKLSDWYFRGDKDNGNKPLRRMEIHRKWLEWLITQGHSVESWPFTVPDRGMRTLHRFFKALDDERPAAGVLSAVAVGVRSAFLSDATGKPINKAYRFLEGIQIDGHKIDAFGTVVIPQAFAPPLLIQLQDVWMVDIVCETGPPLGCMVALTGNYNADDVKICVARALGLIDVPVGEEIKWLPAHYLPELKWIAFDKISMDRALAHQADDLHAALCGNLNAEILFDRAHDPKKRPHVEAFHSLLEERGFRLLPTGYRMSPGKWDKDHAVKLAKQRRITVEDLDEVLKRATLNALTRPIVQYEGQSHLDFLTHMVRERKSWIRKVPDFLQEPASVLRITFDPMVRGPIKKGRRAHVNVANAEYRGDIISAGGAFIGQRIHCEGNVLDARTLVAFLDNRKVDVLYAQSPWDKSPHSYTTRTRAVREFRKAKIRFNRHGDAVQQYLEALRARVAEAPDKRTQARYAKEHERVERELKDAAKAAGEPAPTLLPSAPPQPKIVRIPIKSNAKAILG